MLDTLFSFQWVPQINLFAAEKNRYNYSYTINICFCSIILACLLSKCNYKTALLQLTINPFSLLYINLIPIFFYYKFLVSRYLRGPLHFLLKNYNYQISNIFYRYILILGFTRIYKTCKRSGN